MTVLGFVLFLIAFKYRKCARFAFYHAIGMTLIRALTPFYQFKLEYIVSLEMICMLVTLGCDVRANTIAAVITTIVLIFIMPNFVYELPDDETT